MKKSKQANASDLEDGVDRISNLPDPILHLILSSIPNPTTEEVIRTSILSTRWRYLWTSIPSIDIDCYRGSKFKRNKFRNFVNHVLANNSLNLDSFRLCCSNHYSRSTVWQWVHAAVERNIRQLHLLFCSQDWFQHIGLPDYLVNSDSLEELRLIFDEQRRLLFPKFTGFPALRVLELKRVNLSYKNCLANQFLESCPLLEDLSLIDCEIGGCKILCISCPKLKNLRMDNRNIFEHDDLFDIDTLCGCIKIVCPKLESFEFGAFVSLEYKFKSIGSLKKAVIHPEEYPGQFMQCPFLYAGISHLESVSTSIDIFCDDLCASDGPPSNLKTLKLTTGYENPNPAIRKLIRILAHLPHLESLHLIIEEEYFIWEDWKLDEEETLRILTCHLKKVEFFNFDHEKTLLEIARPLLEHSNALEEMVFRWECDKAKFHKTSMEIMNQVSKFQKASSNVKIVTLNETSFYHLSDKP